MEIHNATDALVFLHDWREYFGQGHRLGILKCAIQGMARCYAITSSKPTRYGPNTIQGYAEALEVLEDALNQAQKHTREGTQ